MAKFKVGDRVKLISNKYFTYAYIGDKGTVVSINYNLFSDTSYGVQMDEKRPFYHNCCGHAADGYGQDLWESCLKLIEDKPTREFKLLITSSGDTTTSKLIHGKDIAKEATVTRYSKDEYSEKAAVEAVVEKIFGEVEKKTEKKDEMFNGVAVCLIDRDCPKFTRGRIYTFVNGNCWNDKGNVMKYEYTRKAIANSIWFLPIVE